MRTGEANTTPLDERQQALTRMLRQSERVLVTFENEDRRSDAGSIRFRFRSASSAQIAHFACLVAERSLCLEISSALGSSPVCELHIPSDFTMRQVCRIGLDLLEVLERAQLPR